MITTIKNWVKKVRNKGICRKYNIKEFVYGEWFSIGIHDRERVDTYLPPQFDENGRFIRYSVGDIVPFRNVKGGVAYYEIIKKKYSSGDWLYGCDAYTYDLKFNHIETNK